MAGKPEWFTCIMPVYNGEKYLREAIESILRQTYLKFEFLIIDDGSTDSSATIIKSYSDPRIRYVYKENGGISSALNLGLKLASHDWVFRMDADDISLPTRFEEQIKTCSFIENEINGCDYIRFRGNKAIHKVTHSKTINNRDIYRFSFAHPAVLYNKNFILGKGGYDERISRTEDLFLWLSIIDEVKITNCSKILFLYRIPETPVQISKLKIVSEERKFFKDSLFNKIRAKQNLDNDEYFRQRGWFEFTFSNYNAAGEMFRKMSHKKRGVKEILVIILANTVPGLLTYLRVNPIQKLVVFKKLPSS